MMDANRERELLEASNRYQQEARDARAALKGGYQDRVHSFMLACFGETIAADGMERNHRFLEESLELVQALGCTASEAHQLVDYVFGRPVGEPHQETGGTMVTLAALCNAHKIDMDIAGETELTRCWSKTDKIRAKQAAKPKHGPLPEIVPAAQGRLRAADHIEEVSRQLDEALDTLAKFVSEHAIERKHRLAAADHIASLEAERDRCHACVAVKAVGYLSKKGFELMAMPNQGVRAIIQNTQDDDFNAALYLAPEAEARDPAGNRLGDIDVGLLHEGGKLDWIIVGGESGPGARPMHPAWARSIRDQCQAAGVPFFFKQWGAWRETDWQLWAHPLPAGTIAPAKPYWVGAGYGLDRPSMSLEQVGKKAAGRLLDGVEHSQFPEVAA
ncbi:DUF5131 family protein [Mesorhizobium sp. M1142]|uniref:DUF5131 family protein n=1 Tax=Mesorhizobium sp. M1142 TaxID=2957060 RepID=UPI0033360CA4